MANKKTCVLALLVLLEKAMKDFHTDNTKVADCPIGPGCSEVG